MNIIETPKKCVGCGACVDSCPTKALRLVDNRDGFYEPAIQHDACVHCGKCLKVCPALSEKKERRQADYYYGSSKDETVRAKSSSGGAFSALAKQILSDGGAVIGASYSLDFHSVVMTSTQERTLDDLRRSKYCQSFSNGMYTKAADFLKEGKSVMMVGTPCQIAAARKIFGENDNLLLVDFLCGGVSPHTAFENYVSYMEQKYRSKVKSINMRDKSAGWRKPKIRIEFENGKVYSARYQFDYYYNYYNTAYLKNEPCLTCSFTNHTDADLTIADFWGYERAKVENDGKGLSLICAYTDKGRRFVDSITNQMHLTKLAPEYVDYAYGEKKHTAQSLDERKRFLKAVQERAFVPAAKTHLFRYGRLGILAKIIMRKVVRK